MSWEIACSIKGRQGPLDGIELDFPLKKGTFYIAQGGNHILVNHHYTVAGQKFALDIVKLNKWGFRSNTLFPSQLEDYNIYGTDVCSPINGYILKINNEIRDLLPPQTDPNHPAGNYVVIQSENSEHAILLAHLQRDSIVVDENAYVRAGQVIGKVGNSGNTSEPHLHIHCVQLNESRDFLFDAVSVPMHFDNKFLSRNALVSSS